MLAASDRMARVNTEPTIILDPSLAWTRASPKNTSAKTLKRYIMVKKAPKRKKEIIHHSLLWIEPINTRYLLKKPPNGGTPITEKAQIRKLNAVNGIVLIKPPIWVISLVLAFCSIIPAHMKSPALARPGISIYSRAPAMAMGLPMARPKKIKAIWLIVE